MKKEKVVYVYVKSKCDIFFSILYFHKREKIRGEAEQIPSWRRGKLNRWNERSKRASGRGMSDTRLADQREVGRVSAIPHINFIKWNRKLGKFVGQNTYRSNHVSHLIWCPYLFLHMLSSK